MRMLAKAAYHIAYQEYERNPRNRGKSLGLEGPLGRGPAGYVMNIILFYRITINYHQ